MIPAHQDSAVRVDPLDAFEDAVAGCVARTGRRTGAVDGRQIGKGGGRTEERIKPHGGVAVHDAVDTRRVGRGDIDPDPRTPCGEGNSGNEGCGQGQHNQITGRAGA